MDQRNLVVFLLLAYRVSTETNKEWLEMAEKELNTALHKKDNTNVAKNVILFLGDGMGVSTVTAARIYKGQGQGKQGEETLLSFEQFPDVALAKTYSNDRQTPDSAATSTGFLCGVKTNVGTLGVNSDVKRGNCLSAKGKEVTSILDWSIAQGKSVGIISTARVTHATPAGAYAHCPDRDWESDDKVTDFLGGCKDIALQLIEKQNVQVILGGGRSAFMKTGQKDPEDNSTSHRMDERDLIKEWTVDKTSGGKSAEYVWNKEQFDAVDPMKTDYLFGLFEASHMQFEIDRDDSPKGEPSIANMTKKAIEILQKNENGFFLLIEGGRIDHAHHVNNAKRALHDTVAMDDAVHVAGQITDQQDTLTIVTADHSHVFNMGGYPKRGTNILGLAEPIAEYDGPVDGLPYTTLVYGNGPSGQMRLNLTSVDTTNVDFAQEAAVRTAFETHAGEDVAIYARGPMSHLFHGVHEQHYIAHVMAYASCVGPYIAKCDRPTQDVNNCQTNSDSAATHPNVFLAILLISYALLFIT